MIDIHIDRETHKRILQIKGVSLKQLGDRLWWIYYKNVPIGNKVEGAYKITYALSKYSSLRELLSLQ